MSLGNLHCRVIGTIVVNYDLGKTASGLQRFCQRRRSTPGDDAHACLIQHIFFRRSKGPITFQ
jgi:hypothetical protein